MKINLGKEEDERLLKINKEYFGGSTFEDSV